MGEIGLEQDPDQSRVLVAEDNPMNQRVIQSLLSALGHAFDIVENGKEAVQAAAGGSYDVVLMDISMPVMSGEMATRIIRAMDDPTKDMPIVALTADAMAEHQASYYEAGMNAVATKPINRSELALAINIAMGKEIHAFG